MPTKFAKTRAGRGRPRQPRNNRWLLGVQTLVDEYGVKRTDAVMLVALLAFPIEAARELVIAAPNTFAELPNLLRHLRDIEVELREAEAGELGAWDAGSDDDLDRDDHQVEAKRMVARLDGDHRAPVLRRRAFDELARRRLTNLRAFRSLYRSIEKSCERIDVRWRDERPRWFEAVAIAAARQPVVGDLDHPGFAAAWSDEELWPGAPCACEAVDGPHRHCDVCQVGAPSALGRHGVRSVAHVHPLTFERRHLGWACPRHRNDIDAPYPLDWIAQYQALGMFRAKTTRIVIELPLSPTKVVALPAKLDCGPEVVTPTVNPWTGEREVRTDIDVLFRIATIGGGS